jgi:hypothetical protein
LTKEERVEFNNFICGTGGGFNRVCWNKRSEADFLVYADGIFRCHTRPCCYRVTPSRGKIVRGAARYEGNGLDAFKQSIINRKIKLFKPDLKAPPMKLITEKGKTWVEIDGHRVSPRRFSSQWWVFNFEREVRP